MSIIFWIGINIINPDAFVTRKNIERLAQGKKLDPFYLSRLSADAIPETVKIFQVDIDEEIKIEMARNLYYRCDSFLGLRYYENSPFYGNDPVSFKKRLKNAEEKQNENWQSFNISERKALLALKENYKEIVKYQKNILKKKRKNAGRE